MDYAEGFISFPIDDDILNGQLRLRIVSRPGFDMLPAELRFDKHLEPVVWFRGAGPMCTSWDYPDETGYTTFHEIAWTPGRARICDVAHLGNGPDYDAIVYRRPEDDPAGGTRHIQNDFRWLYSAWEFEPSPTVKIYDADGVEMMRDVGNQSVFLMDVGARRKKLVLNSGDTNTFYRASPTDPYVKVPYPWEQYELVKRKDEDGRDVCYEPGQCSDITTKRYVMAHVYLNESSGRRNETVSSYAPIYISKMWVAVAYPWFTVTHPDLPYVDIPVKASDASCLIQNWLWEEPIGGRW